MFDPLLNLLAAKAKAVGLVAGTAMVTAALAGGGAVAMTAVSHDGTLHEEPVVEQLVEDEMDETEVETTSDSPTVGIDPTETEAEEGEDPTEGEDLVEEVVEEDGTAPALPADFVCDESKNHGQNVSAYAKSLPKGPGRGELVSAVAQSDCGKKSGEDAEEEATEDTVSTESAETEVEAPKPAKAEKKAAKAEKKAAKKAAKPAKASKPAKAGKAGKGKS